jgi:hypothetical protein
MVLKNNQCLLLGLILIVLVSFFLYLGFQYKSNEGFGNYTFDESKNKLQRNINAPWVMNQELDSVIYKIANAIVKNVNKRLTTNYIMGQFENVIEDYDNDGNKRYVMDFFVYQPDHQAVNDVSRRLIVDLTLFHNSRTIQINTINFSNAIKKSEENNNIRSNNDSDNKLLILSEEALLKEKNQNSPMRFTFKEVLESDPFDKPKPIDITDTDRRPWILPLQLQDKSMAKTRAFPCQDYGHWWDKNGIPLTAEQEKGLPPSDKPKWCYNSYNTATVPQTIVAQRYPQFVKMPYDQANKTNNWMFDKMQGIPGFPHGGSNSG